MRSSGWAPSRRRLHDVAMNTHVLELPDATGPWTCTAGHCMWACDAAGLSEAAIERAARDRRRGLRPLGPAAAGGPDPALSTVSRRGSSWHRPPGSRLANVLPDVLAEAAGSGASSSTFGRGRTRRRSMPAGLGDRTVTLRVDQGPTVGPHWRCHRERVRGEAAHHLLESGADPRIRTPSPRSSATVDWPLRLELPERRGKPWTLTLSID